MRLQRVCALLFENGGGRRGFRKIRSKLFGWADTWSASLKNGAPRMPAACLRMPNSKSAKPYLAFDFGAESGRAILARLDGGVLTTQEIRRFKNEPIEYGGSLHWDVTRLWWEVRQALSSLEETQLAGIAVDAWGVDYALLGEK